jgi:hypothetical protein
MHANILEDREEFSYDRYVIRNVRAYTGVGFL